MLFTTIFRAFSKSFWGFFKFFFYNAQPPHPFFSISRKLHLLSWTLLSLWKTHSLNVCLFLAAILTLTHLLPYLNVSFSLSFFLSLFSPLPSTYPPSLFQFSLILLSCLLLAVIPARFLSIKISIFASSAKHTSIFSFTSLSCLSALIFILPSLFFQTYIRTYILICFSKYLSQNINVCKFMCVCVWE